VKHVRSRFVSLIGKLPNFASSLGRLVKKIEAVRGQVLPKASETNVRSRTLLRLSQIHKPHVMFSHYETLSTPYH